MHVTRTVVFDGVVDRELSRSNMYKSFMTDGKFRLIQVIVSDIDSFVVDTCLRKLMDKVIFSSADALRKFFMAPSMNYIKGFVETAVSLAENFSTPCRL